MISIIDSRGWFSSTVDANCREQFGTIEFRPTWETILNFLIEQRYLLREFLAWREIVNNPANKSTTTNINGLASPLRRIATFVYARILAAPLSAMLNFHLPKFNLHSHTSFRRFVIVVSAGRVDFTTNSNQFRASFSLVCSVNVDSVNREFWPWPGYTKKRNSSRKRRITENK